MFKRIASAALCAVMLSGASCATNLSRPGVQEGLENSVRQVWFSNMPEPSAGRKMERVVTDPQFGPGEVYFLPRTDSSSSSIPPTCPGTNKSAVLVDSPVLVGKEIGGIWRC